MPRRRSPRQRRVRQRRLVGGRLELASWPPTVAVMIATMKIHERWSRTSIPNRRAIGTPFTKRAPTRPRDRLGRRGLWPRRGSPAGPGDRPRWRRRRRSRRSRPPRTIVVSSQNVEREQLDEPVGRRVEEVRAAGEEQPVEDLERGVEREERDRRRRRRPPTIVPSGPGADRPPPALRMAETRVRRRRRRRGRRRRRSPAPRTRRTRRGRRACGSARAR